jgi:hypothetical protein
VWDLDASLGGWDKPSDAPQQHSTSSHENVILRKCASTTAPSPLLNLGNEHMISKSHRLGHFKKEKGIKKG